MYNDVRVYRVKTTVDIEPRTKLSSQHFWSFKNSWWNIDPFINWSNRRLISPYRIKTYFRSVHVKGDKGTFSNFSLWKMWSREYAAIILRSCEKKHLFTKGGKKKKAFSVGIGVTKIVLFLLLRRWQNIFMWCMIKTTSNMQCVNLQKGQHDWWIREPARGVIYLLTSIQPLFFPLILWHLKIFQKTHARREVNIYMTEKIFFS